ncbi:MAG TPA: pyruvate, phosphate dikinase, partial [Candidatus Marinimicrobia bacterium]|nr:pyruvate, phosphate dikinase [Candidatus Neomarinimicrobiota bacterium]
MKYVYLFGNGEADGTTEMKNLLGGKGANLAEMNHLGIPVPPGFTITTDICTHYYNNDLHFPDELDSQVAEALGATERIMGTYFADVDDPLLVSVRSGARSSMPGMMETVLNVGLTTFTIPGLIKKTNNPRFVYDAYRRLIMMYADVVMEKAAGIEPENGIGIRQKLESILKDYKEQNSCLADTDLSAEDWQALSDLFKSEIQSTLGSEFPDDPMKQLWGGIKAVFQSW